MAGKAEAGGRGGKIMKNFEVTAFFPSSLPAHRAHHSATVTCSKIPYTELGVTRRAAGAGRQRRGGCSYSRAIRAAQNGELSGAGNRMGAVFAEGYLLGKSDSRKRSDPK